MGRIVELVFFFGEGLKNAMELAATGGESGYHILGGRLKESDHIGDEFVLALDACQSVELVFTNVNGLFDISGFQAGKNVVFLLEILQELGGSIADIGEHHRSGTLEGAVDFGEIAFSLLESFVQKSVFNHHQLDVALEACAAQSRSLLCIESGGLHEVETGVLFESLGDFSMIKPLSSFFIVSDC